eukprot:1976444-Rhodomonas_salina.2
MLGTDVSRLGSQDAGTVAVKETDAEASLLLGRVRDLIVEARDTGASKANGAEALGLAPGLRVHAAMVGSDVVCGASGAGVAA